MSYISGDDTYVGARFRADDLKVAAQRAVACSLAMLDETQKRLLAMEEMGMDSLDTQLFLHIGVGAGNIRCMTFGGQFDKAEFVVAGPALTEAKDCGELAKSGEAIISKTVMELCESCQPDATKLGSDRLTVDDLESSDFYVINSFGNPPDKPEIPLRSQMLMDLRQCDNSTGAVEEAMRRFVPHPISACVDSGQSPKEAEECRRVTIMFVRLLDIECEPFQYSKAETVKLVQKCILEIYGLLHRYEGTVSRFQIDDKGTVLKIVFGFPLMAHEDDPVRAVHAAIEMRRKLKQIDVQSCIGIATGTTICGLVGNELRLEYTAVGSAVILAARLMQNANCCILVNDQTYKASSGNAVFEKICPIKVKGKDTKVTVYRPVESERRITKKLAPMRDTSLILGREEEVNSMKTLVDEYVQNWSSNASGHAIVLTGPAGIGKATVLGRFLGLMHEGENVRVVKASAEAIEKNTPYYPWKQIFASVLGVEVGAKASQFTHRACYHALHSILGDDMEKHSVLNDVLPVQFPTETGQVLDSHRRREKLTDLLCTLLDKFALKQPTVLVLHACQWCDNSSWALLRQVLVRCLALFVVLTTRNPMQDGEFEQLQGSTERPMHHIPLKPLTSSQAMQLVKKTLGDSSKLDHTITEQVVLDRTQGVPLYCVELARAVKDSGSKSLKELPDTITGAVLLRIDRLLPSPKLVLKIVAVAGKDVSAALIADVVPAKFTKEELQAELEYLVSLDILIRDSRQGYCFRHEMVQEVVRGFLTFSQKRFLHKRIANYYQSVTKAEVSPATLAEHFEAAAKGMDATDLDVPTCKRAIWFLKVAAEEAMKAMAIDDANRYLERRQALVAALPTSTEPFDFEMALGLVDGSEQLLRQVFEQFSANSGTSLERIEKCTTDATNNPQDAPDLLDTIRFEARSIASAASTLGAEQLSVAAIAVENTAVAQNATEMAKTVKGLRQAFTDLCTFVDQMSNHGHKNKEASDAPQEHNVVEMKQKRAMIRSNSIEGDEIVNEMMNDALFLS